MIKTTAIIMAILLITIPIAQAQTLNIIEFGGADKVIGIIKPGESLIAKIQAAIPEERIIDEQQVKIFYGTNFKTMNECANIGGELYECTLTSTNPPTGDYSIKLFDDAQKNGGTALLTRNIKLSVDAIPPQAIISLSPTQTKDGKTQVTYKVIDYLESTGEQPCKSPGIKKLEIKAGTQTIVSKQNQPCSVEGTAEFVQTKTGFVQEKICAHITDSAGNEFTATDNNGCATFTTDNQAPIIGELTIKKNGLPVSHLKTATTQTVTLQIEITGNNNDVSTATINGQSGTKTNNLWTWNNIQITPATNCKIPVTATDILANTATKELNCRVEIDNQEPELKTINGKTTEPVILGKNAILELIFEDKDDQGNQGVGIAPENIIIEGIGQGTTAQECKQEGTQYKCIRQFSPTTDTTTTITIHAADKLGNTATYTRTIQTKVTGPKIIEEPTINILAPESPIAGQTPIQGSTIEITTTAENFATAKADFTQIGDGTKEASCSENQCIFTGQIQNTGPYTAEIKLIFTDETGNEKILPIKLNIAGTQDIAKPDFWKSTPECTPQLIDRETAELINQKVYCTIKLEPNHPAQKPEVTSIEFDRTQCQNVKKLSTIDLVNNAQGTTTPVLVFTLAQEKMDVDNLKIECPIRIYSTTGEPKKFVPKPETEMHNYTIEFYNQPFGTIYEKQQEKIKEKLKDAKDSMKWAGTLRKIVAIAEAICKLFHLLTTLWDTLTKITMILGDVGNALKLFPPTSAVGSAMVQKSGITCRAEETGAKQLQQEKQSFAFFHKFCSFVNCQWTDKNTKGITAKTGSILGGGTQGLFNICAKTNEWLGKTPFLAGMQFGAGGETISTGQEINKQPREPQSTLAKANNILNFAGVGNAKINAINTKESIVWSTLCLCLPGIINGIERIRQMKCQNALCIKREVAQQGFPLRYCEELEDYNLCAWGMGELWNFLPFSSLIDRITNAITEIGSMHKNPMVALQVGLGIYCMCPDRAPGVYTICATTKWVSQLAEAAVQIKQMFDAKGNFLANAFGVGENSQDFCEQLEQLDEGEENEE